MRMEAHCTPIFEESVRDSARLKGVPGQNYILICLLLSIDTTTSSVVVLKADTKVCRLAG
jgi:hypothetical protein